MALRERLREYVMVNTRRGGVSCSTCALPADLLKAIHDEREAGAPYSALAGFLRTEGHNIATHTLGSHFRNHGKR